MLPTLFLSHGSPMHALEGGAAAAAWQAVAAALPRPRAILMVSAHWESEWPMVSSAAQPETIHDFGGFPAALYALRYPAPGAPWLAERVAALLGAQGLRHSVTACRGLDHGAWVPLRWMYPEADVPVVQLSVQTALGAAHHLALGEALAALPGEDVLVVGSGHVTHNLGDWMRTRAGTDAALPYVDAFSDWLADALAARDRDALLAWRTRAPAATRAHPTEEHFLPLFVAWGAAGAAARATRFLQAREGAALAMDAYRFDA